MVKEVSVKWIIGCTAHGGRKVGLYIKLKCITKDEVVVK